LWIINRILGNRDNTNLLHATKPKTLKRPGSKLPGVFESKVACPTTIVYSTPVKSALVMNEQKNKLVASKRRPYTVVYQRFAWHKSQREQPLANRDSQVLTWGNLVRASLQQELSHSSCNSTIYRPALKSLHRNGGIVTANFISDHAWSRLCVDPAELSEIIGNREVFRVLGLLLPRPSSEKSGYENKWMNELHKQVSNWMMQHPVDKWRWNLNPRSQSSQFDLYRLKMAHGKVTV